MAKSLYTRVVLNKKPKFKLKDLSLEGNWGQAIKEDFEIELEKNQPDKEFLSTCVHEIFHCVLPDLNEKQIIKISDLFSESLWKLGYRFSEIIIK